MRLSSMRAHIQHTEPNRLRHLSLALLKPQTLVPLPAGGETASTMPNEVLLNDSLNKAALRRSDRGNSAVMKYRARFQVVNDKCRCSDLE